MVGFQTLRENVAGSSYFGTLAIGGGAGHGGRSFRASVAH